MYFGQSDKDFDSCRMKVSKEVLLSFCLLSLMSTAMVAVSGFGVSSGRLPPCLLLPVGFG